MMQYIFTYDNTLFIRSCHYFLFNTRILDNNYKCCGYISNCKSNIVICLFTPSIERGMDWQRCSILYTIFGSVILNKPETNIAQLAMVIMSINEIEFMSIITIQVGQCLLSVCSTEDKI